MAITSVTAAAKKGSVIVTFDGYDDPAAEKFLAIDAPGIPHCGRDSNGKFGCNGKDAVRISANKYMVTVKCSIASAGMC